MTIQTWGHENNLPKGGGGGGGFRLLWEESNSSCTENLVLSTQAYKYAKKCMKIYMYINGKPFP